MKIADIARLAGVSKATVSSVLNGKAEQYRISQKTQEKVFKVVREHDYQPNHSAASLRSGKSHSIGLIVPDFENRSYLRIAKRLEALARAEGYQLIIASSDDQPETELESARTLVSRGVDALLVSTSLTDSSDYLSILNRGTPVIAIDRGLSDQFSNVISDDYQGALQLTNALPLANLNSVVLIGALPQLSVSQERERGFRAAVSGQTRLIPSIYYGERFDLESGMAQFRNAIADHDGLPDAVITTSYALMEGVIEVLQSDFREALFQSPVCALGTFGNSRLLDFLPMPVVSLPQQYEQIAEAAWSLARQAIESSYQPQKVIIRRKLNRRGVA
ncbi:catabolite repressor/activator [Reinekea blandensis]|uniref:Fructose repressor n=1 Tax=Reinekea blandensis MED297 TaxID=314283 RepID=A4BB49_9GAMM|nr:catabolite repressor/activator [Reinekea blandensis]EAR10662.1 fructose repressor [Reinekea sp. MED297] [Reinekea blandensis MED297]